MYIIDVKDNSPREVAITIRATTPPDAPRHKLFSVAWNDRTVDIESVASLPFDGLENKSGVAVMCTPRYTYSIPSHLVISE